MIRMRDILRDAAPAPAGGGAPPADPKDAEIARLQAALRNPPAPPTPPNNPPAPAVPDRKQLETTFWQNPLEMTAAIAAAAQQNNPANDTLVELAKREARGTDPELQLIWDKYQSEIEQHVATTPPQYRTNIHVWKNAFNFVKGQHMEEIIAAKSKQTPKVNSPDGPATPGVRAPEAPPREALSDDEHFIIRNLGLTEEQYRHGKEIRESQVPRGKSPWDSVVTTDSAERRRDAATKRNKPAA